MRRLEFVGLMCTVCFFVFSEGVVQPLAGQGLEDEVDVETLNATEELLELIVKINADPRRWQHVHHLLATMNKYLQSRKKSNQDGPPEPNNQVNDENDEDGDIKELRNLAKVAKSPRYYYTYNNIKDDKDDNRDTRTADTFRNVGTGKETETEYLEKQGQYPESRKETTNETFTVMNDKSSEVLQTNKKDISANSQTTIPRYQPDPEKGKYRRHFTYRRVNGPLPNYPMLSKKPKAYIAVSVIAPKPMREDSVLENELTHLKQWTRKDRTE